MEIVNKSVAGTLESSDVMIRVAPSDELKVTINSSVKKQFGDQIKATIGEVLAHLEVKKAEVVVQDKGALDFILRARLKAALLRACNSQPDWDKII